MLWATGVTSIATTIFTSKRSQEIAHACFPVERPCVYPNGKWTHHHPASFPRVSSPSSFLLFWGPLCFLLTFIAGVLIPAKQKGSKTANGIGRVRASEFRGMCRTCAHHQGTADYSPCFHLPGFHFGYLFLTHSHMGSTWIWIFADGCP